MKRVWSRYSTALGVLLTSAVVLAQSPPPAGQQAPPTGQQAPPAGQLPPPGDPSIAIPQRPTFKVAVDLITTDVIVRDGRGQFVADLDKDQFEVFEDGVPQAVSSLVLVHGGRVSNLAVPPPPPPPEGIILPPARPTNDASGRIFILFIDDLHLDFKDTHRVRDLLRKIKATLIHEGDMFGVVSTGTSSIAIDMTYDTKRIDEAIGKVMGGGLKPTDIIQAPEGQDGPAEVKYRAHVAFSTAEDLMTQLDQVHNRRKALIYVSNGYDFNPFESSRSGTANGIYENNNMKQMDNQANAQAAQASGVDPSQYSQDPSTTQNNKFADADLARELSELTKSANRANVSIYTMDPRGLVGMPDLEDNVDPTEWASYIEKSTSSLRVLAELTGGIAVVAQNDFDKALKRIDAETSDYYMLGYYSSNPDPLRRTRHVEVRVKRKDLDVWSRKTYSLKSLTPPKAVPPPRR